MARLAGHARARSSFPSPAIVLGLAIACAAVVKVRAVDVLPGGCRWNVLPDGSGLQRDAGRRKLGADVPAIDGPVLRARRRKQLPLNEFVTAASRRGPQC